MPTYAVPLAIKTEVVVQADSKEHAEVLVRTRAAESFKSEFTRIETDTPTCKSAYEVNVTFYLDAFTSDEAEDRVCTYIRDGVKEDRSVSYDVEKTTEGSAVTKRKAVPKKLSLAKAIEYYKAGYPADGFRSMDYIKQRPAEAENIVKEVTAFVYAANLEEACKCAVEFGYGVDGDDDASDWRNHVKFISNIRKAAGQGHYDLDYSAEGIIRDLLELVQTLGKEVEAGPVNIGNLLSYTGKELAKRIELVYGRVWED